MARKKSNPGGGRPYRSGITVSLGMLNFPVDLLTPAKAESKGPKLSNVCPTCFEDDPDAEASPVAVQYTCGDDHGPFESGQLLKAMKDPGSGELRVVGSGDEVNAAKTGGMSEEEREVAKKRCELVPFRSDEVLATTFVGEKSYVLRPAGMEEIYRVLLNLVDENGRCQHPDEGDVIFVGEVLLEKYPKLVRLERWRDQLVLREILRPGAVKEGLEVNETDEARDDYLSTAQAFISMLMNPESGEHVFNPDNYADAARARLDEFVAARLEGEDADVITLPTREMSAPSEADAMMAVLQQSISAQKKKGKKSA